MSPDMVRLDFYSISYKIQIKFEFLRSFCLYQ